MRPVLLVALLAAAACSAPQPPPPEVESVAAFARLYGVARYFYPSDAAAELDWNRFAVYGVGRLRGPADADALAATLLELFEPLGPGFHVAAELPAPPEPADEAGPLVVWQYLGPGFGGGSGPYRAARPGRAIAPVIDGFATAMQALPAGSLRGREVRLRGRARVRARGTGWGAFWLRVDRANQQMGFFDNMGDRQIVRPEWNEYAIEGPVAEDAIGVAFGVMASGGVVADFDAVVLEVRDAEGEWSPVGPEDGGFEADQDASPWQRAGTSANAIVRRQAGEAPEGRQVLRLAAPAPGGRAPALFEDALPEAGAHVDLDLGAGLRARVPIALSGADATAVPDPEALEALTAALSEPADASGLETRLADLVVAWNVFRHFYPYWDEVGVDWDAELLPLLAGGLATPEERGDAVRRLVARARDGHGMVIGSGKQGSRPGVLPLALRVIEGKVAITGSAVPDLAPIGAVVRSIDGEEAVARLERLVALCSGSDHWRRNRALGELSSGPHGAEVSVEVEDGAGVRSVRLAYGGPQRALESRPEPIADLGEGRVYVDITRASVAELRPELPRLAAARGLVFDLRGYPTDSGLEILRHLIDAPEDDRWMHVARITGPFGRVVGWESLGWDLQPAGPHLGAPRAFLTDERAISYAESVMGYVADLGLGTIVGAPTAGTNGNVKRFSLPSGLAVTFTGMRVTRHDGQGRHHLVGIRPDVPLEPTLAGIRAGRDELLERAVALLREEG